MNLRDDWREVTRYSAPGNVGGGCLWVGAVLMLAAAILLGAMWALAR